MWRLPAQDLAIVLYRPEQTNNLKEPKRRLQTTEESSFWDCIQL